MRRGELRAYTALTVACGLAWALLSGFLAGPTVEGRYFPVRTDQRVADVARADGRLCWTWSSLKVRPAATDDLDVFLHVGDGGERMVVAPFGAADGQPWRRAAAAPIGPFTKRYCVAIPPHVPDGAHLRVEQTLYYRGPLGLWRVPLAVPDVVYPSEAAR